MKAKDYTPNGASKPQRISASSVRRGAASRHDAASSRSGTCNNVFHTTDWRTGAYRMDAAAGAMRASEIDARRANLAACHRICRTMRPRGSPASARRQPAQTQGPANPPQAWRMPGVPRAHPGASDSHESTKGSRGRPSRRLCGPHATGVCVRAVNRETRLWGRSAHRMRSSWQTLVERILHPMVAMPFLQRTPPLLPLYELLPRRRAARTRLSLALISRFG